METASRQDKTTPQPQEEPSPPAAGGLSGNDASPKPGEPTGSEREVRYEHSLNLAPLLSSLQASLLVSSYQAGKLVVVGSHQDSLSLSFHNFDRPMGVAIKPDCIAVGDRNQIWRLRNSPDIATRLEPVGEYTGCYLARSAHRTGQIQTHIIRIGLLIAFITAGLCGDLTADPIRYDFGGTWQLVSGTDDLGLDGTPFDYTVIPSNSIFDFTDQAPIQDSTSYNVGSRVLTLSGTTSSDGTYPLLGALQISGFIDNLDSTTTDILSIGGSIFEVNSPHLADDMTEVNINFVLIEFSTTFVNTPGQPDPPPDFDPSEVVAFSLVGNNSAASSAYEISSLTTSAVPEPSTIVLCTLAGGMIGVGSFLRRRRKRKSSVKKPCPENR